MKIKTYIFGICMVLVFWIFFPLLLIRINDIMNLPRFDNYFLMILGVFLVMVNILVVFYSFYLFLRYGKGSPFITEGMPKSLVKNELYRYSRNPIYLSHILGMLGLAMFFGRTLLFLYAAAVAIALHLEIVFLEEPLLRKTFGKNYANYEEKVKRWI